MLVYAQPGTSRIDFPSQILLQAYAEPAVAFFRMYVELHLNVPEGRVVDKAEIMIPVPPGAGKGPKSQLSAGKVTFR